MKIVLSKSELKKILAEKFEISTSEITEVEVHDDQPGNIVPEHMTRILRECKMLLPNRKIQAIKDLRDKTRTGSKVLSLLSAKTIVENIDYVISEVKQNGVLPKNLQGADGGQVEIDFN
jgi:ribosomal protein L7/L12